MNFIVDFCLLILILQNGKNFFVYLKNSLKYFFLCLN